MSERSKGEVARVAPFRSPVLRRHYVVVAKNVVDPFDSAQRKTFHLVRSGSYQQDRTRCDNPTPMNTSAVRPPDPILSRLQAGHTANIFKE